MICMRGRQMFEYRIIRTGTFCRIHIRYVIIFMKPHAILIVMLIMRILSIIVNIVRGESPNGTHTQTHRAGQQRKHLFRAYSKQHQRSTNKQQAESASSTMTISSFLRGRIMKVFTVVGIVTTLSVLDSEDSADNTNENNKNTTTRPPQPTSLPRSHIGMLFYPAVLAWGC